MKKAKHRVFGTLNTCFFAEFSLAELSGTPLPPLTENRPAQKTIAEMGGTPPPLTEKIRQVVFDRFLNIDTDLKEVGGGRMKLIQPK